MENPGLLIGKVLTTGLWIFAAGCFFAWPDTSLSGIGRLLFGVLLVAHLGEFAFVYSKLKSTGKPMGGQFVGMLLYGMLHYAGVRDAVRQTESPA